MTPARHRTFDRFLVVFCSLWLAAALAAPAQASDEPPADFTRLTAELRKAYRAADYAKALEIAEKMHTLRPDNPDVIYNIACLNCLLGKKDKAYEWLEKAVDAGYKDADHVVHDGDLRTMWGEDRFRAIVRKIRSGAASGAKKKSAPEAAAKEPPPGKDKGRTSKKRDEPRMSEAKRTARVEELTQALIAASEKKNYKKALKLALEAREVADIGLTNYNVACMYSLLGEKDKAFEYLERAIEQGLGDRDMVEQMEGDADLKNLHEDPRWEKALQKARKGGGARARKASLDDKGSGAAWKVALPEGYEKSRPAPLIVALHQHGSNMQEALDRWSAVAGRFGAIVVAPQGGHRRMDGGYEWGEKLDEVEAAVTQAIDAVMDEYKIDQRRVVLAGFGEGGWAACGLALRNPDAYRGVVSVAGRFDEEWGRLLADPDVKGLRVCILLGDGDEDEIVESNKDAAKRFKEAGAKVKLRIYKGLGHDFPDDAEEEVGAALEFVMTE